MLGFKLKMSKFSPEQYARVNVKTKAEYNKLTKLSVLTY